MLTCVFLVSRCLLKRQKSSSVLLPSLSGHQVAWAVLLTNLKPASFTTISWKVSPRNAACNFSLVAFLELPFLPKIMFVIPYFLIWKNVLAKVLLWLWFPLSHPLALIRVLGVITISSLTVLPNYCQVAFWRLILHRLIWKTNFLSNSWTGLTLQESDCLCFFLERLRAFDFENTGEDQ